MSLADRLRKLLGADEEPERPQPEPDDDEDDAEDGDDGDEASVYPLW
jgi:hypothetical protein